MYRSWPSINIEELANKGVKELLRADLARLGQGLAEEQESQILTHCRTTATCLPLYVVVMASELARYVTVLNVVVYSSGFSLPPCQ